MNAQRIHDIFDYWLKRSPDHPMLLLQHRNVSYRELSDLVDRAVKEMQDDGVRPGDRVLLVAENCPEHVALVIACSRIGAWSCGVNARMAPAEIAGFADKADSRVMYFTIGVSAEAAQHADRFAARPSAIEGLQRSPVRTGAVAEVGPDAAQIAAIIFTSGTTGKSKGVLVTHGGLLHFARMSAQSRRLGEEDRVYAYLPMTHVFGLATILFSAMYAGAGLMMRTRFSPADVLDALANHGVSNLLGPPTLFQRLLAHMDDAGIPQPQCPSLRYLYTGAGPLDFNLKKAIEARFGQALHHGYGLSEYAGSLCLTSIDAPRDDTAAGRVIEGAEAQIVDLQGQQVPAGVRGEIWIRGIGLTPGYFRDPEATAQVMKPGGWYASGDLGYLADDGALFVVGRLKEMIIRSGFNVYPAEVEAVLNAFPSIRHSAVVGRREADGNEEILAFIEPKPGMQVDETALNAFVRERLAPYKRPSRLIRVETWPMTNSGKIMKRELLRLVAPEATVRSN